MNIETLTDALRYLTKHAGMSVEHKREDGKESYVLRSGEFIIRAPNRDAVIFYAKYEHDMFGPIERRTT